jgi:cation diffusion facilitator family transporter
MSNPGAALRETRAAMGWSLAAGLVMLAIKAGAYWLTGSAALLGDAAESVVHLAAIGFAAYSLRLSQLPPDENHPYGHSKVAFFSAGFEGLLIVAAAVFIAWEAVTRWLAGAVPENAGPGALLTLLSILINLALGCHLLRVGRRHRALILIANGRHVLTDAWTSIGAVAGLLLASWTGQGWWDSLLALVIAANILVSGYHLVRRGVTGLMDEADPEVTARVRSLLERETGARGISFHALRLRNSGHGHHADTHLVFPDHTLLRDAHRLATEVERAVRDGVGERLHIITHLECEGDHDSLHPNGEE